MKNWIIKSIVKNNIDLLTQKQNNKERLFMTKVIARLFSSINYNEHISIAGYSSLYETIIGVTLENITRGKDIYLGNDQHFAWSFLPSDYLLSLQYATLSDYGTRNQERFGSDGSVSMALIQEYENEIQQNGIKSMLNEWLQENKEYTSYLLDHNLTTNITNMSSHLINFYVEKSKQKSWILDLSILVCGCLATPNFFNLEDSLKDLKLQKADNIDVLYEVYNQSEADDGGLEEELEDENR